MGTHATDVDPGHGEATDVLHVLTCILYGRRGTPFQGRQQACSSEELSSRYTRIYALHKCPKGMKIGHENLKIMPKA